MKTHPRRRRKANFLTALVPFVLCVGVHQAPALAGPIDGCADFTQCTAGLASGATAIVQYTFSDLRNGYTPPTGLSPGLNDIRDTHQTQTSQALRAVVGDLCANCAASEFHSAASARVQTDFGVNRAQAKTSFGAAGTDVRGSRSAEVRILTVAEARGSWRDVWTFTQDGHFSGTVLIDGQSDIATQNQFFPPTFEHGASGGFADWFYELMVWDVDHLSPDPDGFDGPTLVTSLSEQGNNEQRPSFGSLQMLDFDFMAGVHYVVTAQLGVTGRNGHSVDLFHTASLGDIVLSGGAAMNTLSGHDYLVSPPPVPEPETYALMLAGLALLGLCARRRRRARTPMAAAGVLALGLLATSAQAAPVTFANQVMLDAPVAFWRMNELPGSTTAVDSSGHANHGTYSAGGITLGAAGLGGGDTAARFDGAGSGRIVVANSATLNPAHITLEALISWSGANGFQQRILEKSRFVGGGLPQYGLNILDDGKLRFEIQVGATNSFIDSVAAVNIGQATAVAATYDGSLMRIYLDGVLDSTQAPVLTGVLPFHTTDLGIGNQVDRERAFNGVIDELAVYDTALSASRLQAHLIPEPSTWALMGVGLAGLVWRRSRRREAALPPA